MGTRIIIAFTAVPGITGLAISAFGIFIPRDEKTRGGEQGRGGRDDLNGSESATAGQH